MLSRCVGVGMWGVGWGRVEPGPIGRLLWVSGLVALAGACDVTLGKAGDSAHTGATGPGPGPDTAGPPTTEELPETEGDVVAAWTGDVSAGEPIALDWAESSSMACFPANLFEYYQGSHVFYEVELPAYSELVITLGPEPTADLSLYAYSLSAASTVVFPPEVGSAVTCEASPDGAPFNGPGVAETVRLTALDDAYQVVIGVAGVEGVQSGAFTLRAALTEL